MSKGIRAKDNIVKLQNRNAQICHIGFLTNQRYPEANIQIDFRHKCIKNHKHTSREKYTSKNN